MIVRSLDSPYCHKSRQVVSNHRHGRGPYRNWELPIRIVLAHVNALESFYPRHLLRRGILTGYEEDPCTVNTRSRMEYAKGDAGLPPVPQILV